MKIVKCCFKEYHAIIVLVLLLFVNRCRCQRGLEESRAIPYNMQPSYGAEYPFYYQSYDDYYYSNPDYQTWLNNYMNWLLMKRQYDDAARYHVNSHEYSNVMTPKPVEILPEKPEYDQLLLKTLNKYNSILKNYYGHIKQLHKFISKQEESDQEHSRKKHKPRFKNGHLEAKKELGEEVPGYFDNKDVTTLKYDVHSSIGEFQLQSTNERNFFTKSPKMDKTSERFNKIPNGIESKKINYDSSTCKNEFCATKITVTEKPFVSNKINTNTDASSEVAIKIKNVLEHTTEISDLLINVETVNEEEKEDFKSTTTGKFEMDCTITAQRTSLENKYTSKNYFDKLITTCDKKCPYTDKPEVFDDNADPLVKTTNYDTGNTIYSFNKENGVTEAYPEIKNKNKQSDSTNACSSAGCTEPQNVLDINKSKCYVTCDDRQINKLTSSNYLTTIATPISDDEDYLEHSGTTIRSITDLQSSSLNCHEKEAGHERSCYSIELHRKRLLREEYMKYLYTTNSIVEHTTENCNPAKMGTTDMDTNALECRNCTELNEIRDMVKRLRLIGISFLDMGHLLLDEDYRYPIMPKYMDHVTNKP